MSRRLRIRPQLYLYISSTIPFTSFLRSNIILLYLTLLFLFKTGEEVNAHGWMKVDCWLMMMKMKKRIKERKTCYSDSVILYHQHSYLQSIFHFHISVDVVTLTLSINFNNSPLYSIKIKLLLILFHLSNYLISGYASSNVAAA